MFIRQIKKQRSKTSKIFYQYSLAQSSRINGEVKQNNILYLGSDVRMQDKNVRTMVLDYLKAKIFNQKTLFPVNIPKDIEVLAASYYEKYLIKYGDVDVEDQMAIPPAPERVNYETVAIDDVEVENVRTFGNEHLCKQTLEKLDLQKCLSSVGFNDKMCSRALLSICSRAIFTSSEYKTAQYLKTNSSLQECYGIESAVTHKQLYHVTDKLYENREQIDKFLYNRITNLFNLEDKLVIFDISNTYFETRKPNSKLAKYGRSKEKRFDCPLVVFTGVINAEGFIRHSKIYQGNITDAATLKEMIDDLKSHTNSEKQTVVIDAGIATKDNLEYIKSRQLDYVCVSRNRLKDYPLAQESTTQVLTNKDKNPVELYVFKPEGYTDTWMYVQSEDKRKKECSMSDKLHQMFVEELDSVYQSTQKKFGTKTIDKVHQRIGRVKEKHKRVSGQYKIAVTEDNGLAVKISWEKIEKPIQKDKEKGVYFIRTSYKNPKEKELWEIYNTIREVESTFRCLKSDLNIRPIHHQKDQRIESHIYLSILAYQLVNTIRHMLKLKEIHHDWTNIVRIMNTHTLQTVKLKTKTKVIKIRKPCKPIEEVQQIYKATLVNKTQTLPNEKYVVYH